MGAKLRARLTVSLVSFAIAPTLLFFYITMQFITTSFETWFSEKSPNNYGANQKSWF